MLGKMGKYIGAMLMALLLVSCGGGGSAPRNLDDACALVRERPSYLAAMRASERRWGVPVAVQMATIYQESRFVANARTPHRYALGVLPMGRQSTAYGYSQAIDSTWDDYRKATRQRSAKRTRIKDATDFIGWYMNGTTTRLSIAKSDARNQYLAYHEGRTGYARGTHRSKGWLIQTADKVQSRAQRYDGQLRSCNKI
jgi:hypothetical protein